MTVHEVQYIIMSKISRTVTEELREKMQVRYIIQIIIHVMKRYSGLSNGERIQ